MSDPIIETGSGSVRGIPLGGGVAGFRGIPYAAAPVGALRWKPPQPAAGWGGVRDATAFGHDAIQVAGLRETRAPGQSEDCLYLNVWAPEERRGGGWPVIVWSGGGAFSTGGGSFVVEDLARLAARGAVVVSFNYRLGLFGFLAHPALTAESPTGSSGNYGLMDHVAALKWVRDNIAAFGGDSGRITYMAESSGAAAGLLLLTTPIERRLFDHAIFLSPGSIAPLLTLEEAERSAAGLEGSVEDLRSMPADALLAATKALSAAPSNLSVARPVRPIVDGWLIDTDRAYERDGFDAIPAIIGTNEDEGRFFTRRMGIGSQQAYAAYLKSTFGDYAAEAMKRYPAGSDAEVGEAVAAAYGDVSINHPTEKVARAFARRQPNTYRFVYSYRHGETTQPPTHSEEAETFLDTRPHVGPDDGEMAETVQSYLLAFAESGRPNAPGLTKWPRFELGAEQHLSLDLPVRAGGRWRADAMDFCADVFETEPAS
ncbi:carboxylesterase family protein [Sphingomonas sp. CGMCC 1.13654]|uniref:Carboxylesterase family protein n=1 Tax=Sphingomonas chungangi TaxID=2683589 RepID=A0A838L5V6_9SPHN|nr:carboxylesterase family protein [Sphingomonas chungangi]MBA2933566.1 carboxylesterase family protein [Sphingomonas chungangi]MVW54899.1 carboxylesterase family protein [Sphingomonas chungangi]